MRPGICISDGPRQDDRTVRAGITKRRDSEGGLFLSSTRLPLGAPLPDWTRRPSPQHVTIDGRTCRIEPLNVERHGEDLVAAFRVTDESSWAYLFSGPFANDAHLLNWIADCASSTDLVFSAIIDRKTNRAAGMCAAAGGAASGTEAGAGGGVAGDAGAGGTTGGCGAAPSGP